MDHSANSVDRENEAGILVVIRETMAFGMLQRKSERKMKYLLVIFNNLATTGCVIFILHHNHLMAKYSKSEERKTESNPYITNWP